MENTTKGVLALAVAVYMGMGPVQAIIQMQEMEKRGQLAPYFKENKGLLAIPLLIPVLLVWYGVSKLRGA